MRKVVRKLRNLLIFSALSGAGKTLLDKETVDIVSVQAGAEWRHLVVVDDANKGMQFTGAYETGVHVGVRDMQDILHNT